jgi:transposase
MFVDNLDEAEWRKLGIGLEGELLGAPAYHPRVLLGVWLYGFMTSIRSSRKLEAACRDQMPYLWLTGWQHPDHNTLWRFYKEHRIEMRHLFKLTVRTAVNMDLMDMAVQAIFFFSPAVVSLVGYTNLLAY